MLFVTSHSSCSLFYILYFKAINGYRLKFFYIFIIFIFVITWASKNYDFVEIWTHFTNFSHWHCCPSPLIGFNRKMCIPTSFADLFIFLKTNLLADRNRKAGCAYWWNYETKINEQSLSKICWSQVFCIGCLIQQSCIHSLCRV